MFLTSSAGIFLRSRRALRTISGSDIVCGITSYTVAFKLVRMTGCPASSVAFSKTVKLSVCDSKLRSHTAVFPVGRCPVFKYLSFGKYLL